MLCVNIGVIMVKYCPKVKEKCIKNRCVAFVARQESYLHPEAKEHSSGVKYTEYYGYQNYCEHYKTVLKRWKGKKGYVLY